MLPATADLTRHIRAFGPLLPVFYHRGELVDGRRRLQICEQHAIKLPRVDLKFTQVKPLLWHLHPERIRREDYKLSQKPAVEAAHDCWSDPGTIAAYWLKEQPRETYRWQRVKVAVNALLNAAAEGRMELTTDLVLDAVRRNL